MSMIRAALIAAFGYLALYQPGRADPAPIIHYAPAENLEHMDVALIDTAAIPASKSEAAKRLPGAKEGNDET